MKLYDMKKLDDFMLFNFLARDKDNAEEIMHAGAGFIVPGIVSSDFKDIEAGIEKVRELKKAAPVVSVGLGDGGNPENWEKVLKIAAGSDPGHINQPFGKSSFSRGYLHGIGHEQVVNGLVSPSGNVGTVMLSSVEMKVEDLLDLAVSMGVVSIKFMPLKGTAHLEELVYLCKVAAVKGNLSVEPAGGISADNIGEIVQTVRGTGVSLFMPHIFGSTIDKQTGRTLPEEVSRIVNLVRR